MSKLLSKALWKVARTIHKVTNGKATRLIEVNGDPYLLRVYLLPRWFKWRPFLHHFFRGDNDRELHNHPWGLSASLILTGGYSEERLERDCDAPEIKIRHYLPGSINVIRSADFHRVMLLDDKAGCWTLFVAGNREQDWGFLDPETKIYTPHKEYFDG